MNKITEGRGSTYVFMDNMKLKPTTYKLDNMLCTDMHKLNIKFYYESAIPATTCEPPSPELFELLAVSVNERVRFYNDVNTYVIPQNDNFLDVLSEATVEDIITQIKMTCQGALRYVDPDSLRPDVDERARRELGWGLLGDYK